MTYLLTISRRETHLGLAVIVNVRGIPFLEFGIVAIIMLAEFSCLTLSKVSLQNSTVLHAPIRPKMGTVFISNYWSSDASIRM